MFKILKTNINVERELQSRNDLEKLEEISTNFQSGSNSNIS